jgi:diguanylate cyclase (GGDEF)-like protein
MGKVRENPSDANPEKAPDAAAPAARGPAMDPARASTATGGDLPELVFLPAHPAVREAPQRHTSPILLGLEGSLRNQRFALRKRIVTIGRDMSADIIVRDHEVSKRHAHVIFSNIERIDERPQCRLYDAGITSGTFVNGNRVGQGGVLLQEKDRIHIGRTVMSFFLEEAEGEVARRLEEIATRDLVSGLLNFATFRSMLEREMARAKRHKRPLSMALIDVDGFRTINDRYERAGGDAVLHQLGSFLTSFCRINDIAARYAQDSILLLLAETDRVGAQVLAERLCELVSGMDFRHGSISIRITVSLGVAEWQWSLVNAEDFVSAAETALRKAQARGPGHVALDTEAESTE